MSHYRPAGLAASAAAVVAALSFGASALASTHDPRVTNVNYRGPARAHVHATSPQRDSNYRGPARPTQPIEQSKHAASNRQGDTNR
jgi:hypothetical protein